MAAGTVQSSVVVILAAGTVLTECDKKVSLIRETDAPTEVVIKAEHALALDQAHRCRQQTTFGAYGTSSVVTVEVAGPDRMHMTYEETGRQPGRREIILIGSVAYARDNDGPWQSVPPNTVAYLNWFHPADPRQLVIDHDRYRGWQIDFGGRQDVDGTPTLLYEFVSDTPFLHRTIRTWVGIYDGLLHKQERIDIHREFGATESRDLSLCTYGERIRIEAPQAQSLTEASAQQARWQIAANESSAVSSLRTINTALVTYVAMFGRGYPSRLRDLGRLESAGAVGPGSAMLIDSELASGTKSGYTFVYVPGGTEAGLAITYTIQASPASPGQTGLRYFFTDESAVVRFNTSQAATKSDPPLSPITPSVRVRSADR